MLYMIPSPFLPLLYKLLGHFGIFSFMAGGMVAVDVNFRNNITLGSTIVAVLMLAIAGIYTVRSKIANIWRQEAEGQRAAKERLQDEINKMIIDRSKFEKEQQNLRHDLKDKIAEQGAQLKVMEAKTDLTSALDALREISTQQHAGHQETHRILEEIRDKLPTQPILVETVEGDKE